MQSNSRRDMRFGLVLVGLLVVPALLGFSIASSQALEPPDPASVTVASIPSGPTVTAAPQVVSNRPVGEAPISAQDALSRVDTETGGFPRLQYNIDGSGDVRLNHGGAIPLGNGLEMAVNLDPYPANRFDIDVRYTLRRTDGDPIDNAVIDVDWDMSFMYHGPFEMTMTNLGGGLYEGSYDFFMFGPWFLDTTVTVPGAPPIDFRLSIYVWPSG